MPTLESLQAKDKARPLSAVNIRMEWAKPFQSYSLHDFMSYSSFGMFKKGRTFKGLMILVWTKGIPTEMYIMCQILSRSDVLKEKVVYPSHKKKCKFLLIKSCI